MYPSEILFGSPISNILTLSVSAIIFLSHAVVGNVVLGGKTSILSQSFVGISINSALISILINFSGLFARIYMIISIISLVCVNIYNLVKKKSYRQMNSLGNRGTIYAISLVTISVILSLLNEHFNKGIYNGHWTYFSGIPLELIQADYNSRLRILDNYPAVWPKYHFFQGSMHAIFLILLPGANFNDYTLSKYLMFAVFGIIGWLWIRNQSSTRGSAGLILLFVLFLLVTVFRSNSQWAIFSNNLMPNFALLASIELLRKKIYFPSLIYALISALAISRMIVPVFFSIVIVSIFLLQKRTFDIKSFRNFFSKPLQFLRIVLTLMLFLAIPAQLLAGKSSASYFSQGINFREMLVEKLTSGWLETMSSGVFSGQPDLENSRNFGSANGVYFCILGLIVLVLAISNSAIRLNRIRISLWFSTAILLSVFFLSQFLHQTQSGFRFLSISLLGNYILVILFVFLLAGRDLFVLLPFLVLLLFQVFFALSEIGIPAWYTVEFIIIYLIVAKIAENRFKFHISSTLFVLVIFSTILVPIVNPVYMLSARMDDSSTHIYHNQFISIPKDMEQVNCFEENFKSTFLALDGRRIYYEKSKSDRYSISKTFVTSPREIQYYVNLVCKK